MLVGVFLAGFEVCICRYCLNSRRLWMKSTGCSEITHQLGCDQITSSAVKFEFNLTFMDHIMVSHTMAMNAALQSKTDRMI